MDLDKSSKDKGRAVLELGTDESTSREAIGEETSAGSRGGRGGRGCAFLGGGAKSKVHGR